VKIKACGLVMVNIAQRSTGNVIECNLDLGSVSERGTLIYSGHLPGKFQLHKIVI